MCVPSWPRTEDLCAFLSAAFDNARPKPVDIFLPPLRLPPIVFVVSLLLDDVHAMYVSHARLCSGGNVKCRRRFETSLFPKSVENTFSKHRERLSSFRREKNKERERERESFRFIASISVLDRAYQYSFGKRVRCCRPIAGKSIEQIESHQERERRSYTRNQSSWRQKSSA